MDPVVEFPGGLYEYELPAIAALGIIDEGSENWLACHCSIFLIQLLDKNDSMGGFS